MRRIVLVLSVLGLAAACESTEPSPIAGTWVATSFLFTEAGEAPVDVLGLGGGLSITITSNNSTTGMLTIPGELAGGGPDLEVSMVGTAAQSGNTVEFNQSADTFVRDVVWTLAGNTLHTTRTSSGVTIDITLTRM